MAKRVFIFGAGASASMGTPVLRDFLDRANGLLESVSNPRIVKQDYITKDAFELVFDVVDRRLAALHGTTRYDAANLEEIFNLIEMGQLLERFPQTDPKELPRLGRAIRTMLAETVERTTKFPYDSISRQFGAPEDYGRLLSQCGKRDEEGEYAFITFNYDLGLEMAMHLYQVPYYYGLGAQQSGQIPVLKLHGSLNWAQCGGCHEILQESIPTLLRRPRNQASESDTSNTLRSLEVTRELGSDHACGKRPSRLDPLLVPPGWAKTQYHKTFKTIWARAAKEISEARDICIIGYSFPPADAFFHALMGLSLVGGARLRNFVVVDPVPDVRQRFRDILGPHNESRFVPIAGLFANFLNSDSVKEFK